MATQLFTKYTNKSSGVAKLNTKDSIVDPRMEDEELEMDGHESQGPENTTQTNTVTSFENIILFLTTNKYPGGLNLNQKRTLRKAAVNFCMEEGNLYYIGKTKVEKRLVMQDVEKKRQIFVECHSLDSNTHCGQKKTLEKMESLYFWRGMVKDVVTWIQSCELCREREEKRLSSSNKRPRQANQLPGMHGLSNLRQQASTDCPPCPNYNPTQHLRLLDKYEQEILSMAQKAEMNIDDAMDYLLSNIIKSITRRKRELKVKVSLFRDKALLNIKLANAKIGISFDQDKNPDTKINNAKDIPSNEPQLSLRSFDFLPREHFGGVWSIFDVSRAHGEFETLISSVGEIYNAPPYTVSHIIQMPAGVRIFASNVSENDSQGECIPKRRRLRLSFRPHIPEDIDTRVDEKSVQYFQCPGNETQPVCYVSGLEPHQVYEFYLSHQDEGCTQWSPWTYPYLAITTLPSFSWDHSSNDWNVASNLREATKRINSVTPLFLSAPQFFPGCKICVEVLKRDVMKYSEEGLALVQPWVQFSSLRQEGTLFLNLAGQLYLDGKFMHCFAPQDSIKTTLTIESSSNTISTSEGMLIRLCVSYQTEMYSLEWNLRGDGESYYIGIQLNNQGSIAKII